MSEVHPADLWGKINQLESILEVINEDMVEMITSEDPASRKHALNRAHNLLGAAQGVAGDLARATGVR